MIADKNDALIFLHQIKLELKVQNKQWIEIIERDIRSIDAIISRVSELENGPINLASLTVSLLHYFRADLIKETRIPLVEKDVPHEEPQA